MPTNRMFIQLQLRENPSDPNGFEWSPGNHLIDWNDGKSQVRLEDDPSLSLEEGYPLFYVLGPNPTGGSDALFYRVSESVALEAARTRQDAP